MVTWRGAGPNAARLKIFQIQEQVNFCQGLRYLMIVEIALWAQTSVGRTLSTLRPPIG